MRKILIIRDPENQKNGFLELLQELFPECEIQTVAPGSGSEVRAETSRAEGPDTHSGMWPFPTMWSGESG